MKYLKSVIREVMAVLLIGVVMMSVGVIALDSYELEVTGKCTGCVVLGD